MTVAVNDVGRSLNASPRELGMRRLRVAPFIGYDLRFPEASSVQAVSPPSAAKRPRRHLTGYTLTSPFGPRRRFAWGRNEYVPAGHHRSFHRG